LRYRTRTFAPDLLAFSVRHGSASLRATTRISREASHRIASQRHCIRIMPPRTRDYALNVYLLPEHQIDQSQSQHSSSKGHGSASSVEESDGSDDAPPSKRPRTKHPSKLKSKVVSFATNNSQAMLEDKHRQVWKVESDWMSMCADSQVCTYTQINEVILPRKCKPTVNGKAKPLTRVGREQPMLLSDFEHSGHSARDTMFDSNHISNNAHALQRSLYTTPLMLAIPEFAQAARSNSKSKSKELLAEWACPLQTLYLEGTAHGAKDHMFVRYRAVALNYCAVRGDWPSQFLNLSSFALSMKANMLSREASSLIVISLESAACDSRQNPDSHYNLVTRMMAKDANHKSATFWTWSQSPFFDTLSASEAERKPNSQSAAHKQSDTMPLESRPTIRRCKCAQSDTPQQELGKAALLAMEMADLVYQRDVIARRVYKNDRALNQSMRTVTPQLLLLVSDTNMHMVSMFSQIFAARRLALAHLWSGRNSVSCSVPESIEVALLQRAALDRLVLLQQDSSADRQMGSEASRITRRLLHSDEEGAHGLDADTMRQLRAYELYPWLHDESQRQCADPQQRNVMFSTLDTVACMSSQMHATRFGELLQEVRAPAVGGLIHASKLPSRLRVRLDKELRETARKAFVLPEMFDAFHGFRASAHLASELQLVLQAQPAEVYGAWGKHIAYTLQSVLLTLRFLLPESLEISDKRRFDWWTRCDRSRACVSPAAIEQNCRHLHNEFTQVAEFTDFSVESIFQRAAARIQELYTSRSAAHNAMRTSSASAAARITQSVHQQEAARSRVIQSTNPSDVQLQPFDEFEAQHQVYQLQQQLSNSWQPQDSIFQVQQVSPMQLSQPAACSPLVNSVGRSAARTLQQSMPEPSDATMSDLPVLPGNTPVRSAHHGVFSSHTTPSANAVSYAQANPYAAKVYLHGEIPSPQLLAVSNQNLQSFTHSCTPTTQAMSVLVTPPPQTSTAVAPASNGREFAVYDADAVAAEVVSIQPAAAEPVAVEPAAAEPVAVQPVAVEPVAAEPAAIEDAVEALAHLHESPAKIALVAETRVDANQSSAHTEPVGIDSDLVICAGSAFELRVDGEHGPLRLALVTRVAVNALWCILPSRAASLACNDKFHSCIEFRRIHSLRPLKTALSQLDHDSVHHTTFHYAIGCLASEQLITLATDLDVDSVIRKCRAMRCTSDAALHSKLADPSMIALCANTTDFLYLASQVVDLEYKTSAGRATFQGAVERVVVNNCVATDAFHLARFQQEPLIVLLKQVVAICPVQPGVKLTRCAPTHQHLFVPSHVSLIDHTSRLFVDAAAFDFHTHGATSEWVRITRTFKCDEQSAELTRLARKAMSSALAA
jgi:hypothetical protein